MFERLYDTVVTNPIATGMVMTAITGYVAFALRNIPATLWRWITTFSFVQLTFNSSDSAFEWADSWLSANSSLKYARSLRATSSWDEDGKRTQTLTYGYGWHFAWVNGWPLFVHRRVLDKMVGWTIQEEITIRIPAFTHKRVRAIFEEMRLTGTLSDLMEVRVWLNGYWERANRRSRLDPAMLCLPEEQREELFHDIDTFVASRDDYRRKAAPYRRSYLFSGGPGTGKTTLATAIASHLGWNVYILSLSSITGDTALLQAFINLPPKSVLVIEDIDATKASHTREPETTEDTPPASGEPLRPKLEKEKFEPISMSGLLNAIDGIATPENFILIMTTNHPEKLDPAMLRPGRVDRHVVIDGVDKPVGSTWIAKRDMDLVEPVVEAVQWPATVAVLQNQMTIANNLKLAGRLPVPERKAAE